MTPCSVGRRGCTGSHKLILPRMLNADAEGVECDRDPKVDFCHCHPKERKKVRAISPLSLSPLPLPPTRVSRPVATNTAHAKRKSFKFHECSPLRMSRSPQTARDMANIAGSISMAESRKFTRRGGNGAAPADRYILAFRPYVT